MRGILTAVACVAMVSASFAQQDPQFTQYMFDRLSINPGVAGTTGSICATGLLRQQWSGFDGAPKTGLFNAHMPINKINSGVGLSVYFDELGQQKNTLARLSYSYHVKGLGVGTLGIGVYAGMTSRSLGSNWKAVDNVGDDNAIPDNGASGGVFDLGFGAYYVAPKYYVGISSTQLPEGELAKRRASIVSTTALADIARLTGQPCKAVPGRRAAATLAKRLFPQKPPRIEVLRDGLLTPAHLPGNILLLPAQLLETADGPDIIAGHLLIEALRASAGDPVDAVLTHIGLANTLGLLTTGKVPSDALKGFGETFLAPSPDPLMPPMPLLDQQLAAFEGAQVSSAAYGAAVGAANPSGQALVRKDPFALGAPAAVMSDENWLEFQAICSS